MTSIGRKAKKQHLHRKPAGCRDTVRRKMDACQRFIQLGLIAQGVMLAIATTVPALVWSSYGSWMRIIRPGKLLLPLAHLRRVNLVLRGDLVDRLRLAQRGKRNTGFLGSAEHTTTLFAHGIPFLAGLGPQYAILCNCPENRVHLRVITVITYQVFPFCVRLHPSPAIIPRLSVCRDWHDVITFLEKSNVSKRCQYA